MTSEDLAMVAGRVLAVDLVAEEAAPEAEAAVTDREAEAAVPGEAVPEVGAPAAGLEAAVAVMVDRAVTAAVVEMVATAAETAVTGMGVMETPIAPAILMRMVRLR